LIDLPYTSGNQTSSSANKCIKMVHNSLTEVFVCSKAYPSKKWATLLYTYTSVHCWVCCFPFLLFLDGSVIQLLHKNQIASSYRRPVGAETKRHSAAGDFEAALFKFKHKFILDIVLSFSDDHHHNLHTSCPFHVNL
jgi:hypothetical protein